MRKKNTVLLTLILLFTSTIYTALSQNLIFSKLGVKEGLSQSSINAVYQDEFDQIWIATRDGLNKYDGNKVEQIKPILDGNSNNILFDNNVSSVTGNKQGQLYMLLSRGLVLYDIRKQKFEILDSNNVNCISYGTLGLWVGSRNKISFLPSGERQLQPHITLDANVLIKSVFEASSGDLYIGTQSHGLFVVYANGKPQPLIKNIEVVCLYEDDQKRIWAGTVQNGLYCINNKGGVENYRHQSGDSKSLSNDFVRSICQDNSGHFWIGTADGLNYCNMNDGNFRIITHSDFDIYSISSSSIWCITKDRQGSLWIGTFSSGLNIVNPQYSFDKYYRIVGDNKGLNNSIVSNISEDKNGNLWIGTDYGGLNYYNKRTKTFTYYTHNPFKANSLSSNIIKAIWVDDENECVWIGTNIGGLNKLDLNTKQIERITLHPNNPRVNNYVRSIVKHEGKLLLGTHGSIQVYDIKNKTVTPLIEGENSFNNTQIWNMKIDSKDRLWFSVNSHVFRYNLKDKELKEYLYYGSGIQEKDNIFNACFFEDTENRMWIGSSNKGLGLYNSEKDSIAFYNTNNSNIIDNYILDINETPMGYLLVATNKGISRYDIENNTFQNFYSGQFFPFDALVERCIFTSHSGDIILGSLNGMLIISERDFALSPQECKINLTALRVNNALVYPGDESGILDESILVTDKIALNNSHSMFSVEFSTSNYIKTLQISIQYILEGFDTDWIDIQDYNIVTYTNLNPGKYTLRIRGVEKSTQHMIPEKIFEITIHPPFYKTWYAYLIYLLSIAGIFCLIFSQIKLKASLKYAYDEKKHIQELNQYKLRFFTNISHEIRTPVTLIISQLEILLQRNDLPQYVRRKITNTLKNTANLKVLINELLDFRKQEQGFMQIKVSEQDIVKYIEDIFSSFKDTFNNKQINTSFIHKEDEITMWFDTKQIRKVFFNLLSNAFKFTPPKGSVSLTVERKNENWVNISVSDTGIGIKKEEIDKLFERFFQGDHSNSHSTTIDSGTGIGLALVKGIVEAHGGTISVQSSENKGSVFTVSLLLGDTHFKESEKTEEVGGNLLQRNQIEMPEKEFLEEIQKTRIDGRSEVSILIVEDNEELLHVLVDIFQPIYNVYTSTNGAEGLQKAIELKPDIILTDVMMPQMSGVELCKRVKSNVDICHTSVVLLTARTAVESNIEGLMVGADDYITKPFDTRLLISRCNNLINNKIIMQRKFMESSEINTSQLALNSYDQQLLEKAVSIVEDNIEKPDLDVAFFAKEMCMGRSSLFSKIKALTGLTPRDFIINIKIKKGNDMLKKNMDLSVSEISFRLGFSDASYFIKLFKQNHGITPNQFRQKHKQ